MRNLLLLLSFLPLLAYADDSLEGNNIHINAGSTVTICAEDSIRLSTNCDSGTTNTYILSDDGSAGSAGAYVIKVDNDANRIFTFDATSDTALTFKFGDSTASQDFVFSSASADLADNDALHLSGGGAAGGTRGGTISLYGNENASAGNIDLTSGSDAGSDISLFAIDDIAFFLAQDTNRKLAFDGSSDTVMTLFYGDGSTTANQTFSIQGVGGSNDDDTQLNLAGGSANAITEGAVVIINGNEFSGGGDITLNAGDTTGEIFLKTTAATTDIELDALDDIVFQANNVTTFTMDDTGQLIGAGTATIGWAVVDGADNTACSAQCTTPGVFGFNLAAGATAPVLVGPADTTADICLCAGAT